MRTFGLRLLFCLGSFFLLAPSCTPTTTITVSSPSPEATVTDCSVTLSFELVGAFSSGPSTFLNFAPLSVPLVEGPPGTFTATIGVEDGLLDENVLIVKADRQSDGETLTQGVSFTHSPTASAYEVTDPGDLITGPLAHGRVGDFMLESCVARFTVQKGAQRDLYSVGQYGGNLIDAERIGSPGLDNFLEVQTMVNVETVLNAQTVVIVNDGADGQPAVVRACGPDDLLDFVNPSTVVTDAGLPFPAFLDDNDQTVEGCTDYSLAPRDSHVAMTTTLTNTGASPIELIAGDWMNAGGELDTVAAPSPGVGSPAAAALGGLGFHGFDDAVGVDYGYANLPETTGGFAVISGVSVILHEASVISVLLGLQGGRILPAGESFVLQRFFSVGEGSGSNGIDLDMAVEGAATATVQGCVTVGGVPAPNARVTIGTFAGSTLQSLANSFVTDAAGCYSGNVRTPSNPTNYGVVAAKRGAPYEGGAATPPVTSIAVSTGDTETVDFALPATGSLRVSTTNAAGDPLPTRVSVVGFDPSPPIVTAGPSIPGIGGSSTGLFDDPNDLAPFGIVVTDHTGADGVVEFDLEPGDYRVFVSRGTEYSTHDQPVTITANVQSVLAGQIVHVLDTDGFVSSDFHVHGINSADSRVSHRKRVEGYAGEGVDNIIMTDHHVHTDLDPTIAALGLGDWVSSTIGEEITTFDYGHFNGYPMLVDATRISGGSTDWAKAAPPGQDFPSAGAFNAPPAELYAIATTGVTSTPDTVVQVNHIDDHFGTLQIDTSLVPPQDGLDAAERLARRFGEPVGTNLFFAFPALELWNGHTRGAQSQFLDRRIGVWFNLLNQGIPTTFIADTDSHRHTNLRMSGARTWTPAAPGSDGPGTVDGGEVANMVTAGKATGGQGVFVTTVLRATDGSGAQADLTRFGTTHVSDAGGNVELDIRIQAPAWSGFDTVEIYANATTNVVNPAAPYQYSATPNVVLSEGDCDPTTTGDGDFDVSVVPVSVAPSASRLETVVTVPFSGLTEDTWFVVVVKGTDGQCPALFPVFASNLDSGSNPTLADLLDGNVGESGVLALGATNALYYDAP